jgi:hypothetical protein
MVSQVKVISILMIVNGVCWLLFGGLYAAFGPLLAYILVAGPPPANPDDKIGMKIGVFYCTVTGLIAVIVGLLLIVAGIRCLKFRGRVLGIVALFCNVLALPTCSLPTCLAVIMSLVTMIYGLIVLFQSDVGEAFARGESGQTPAEILDSFAGGQHGYWQEN